MIHRFDHKELEACPERRRREPEVYDNQKNPNPSWPSYYCAGQFSRFAQIFPREGSRIRISEFLPPRRQGAKFGISDFFSFASLRLCGRSFRIWLRRKPRWALCGEDIFHH
jgi:hypothetical protein